MSQANEAEQLMLSLINEERREAGLAPLTFNGDLNEAAEDHSDWMLAADRFSHTGENGSSVQNRATEAGYELEGRWAIGENIGWQSERGAPGIEDDVRDIHQSLMESPGHRANILSTDYDEIGIGIEMGDFRGSEGVMITQNFGATDADPAPEAPPATPPVTPEPTEPAPSEPVTPEPPAPADPEPAPPADPQPAPSEPEEPPVSENPFDPDSFIAQLTALLEDLFDNLQFAGWGGWENVNMGWTGSDDTDTSGENADQDSPWTCDTATLTGDTGTPMNYELDLF